MLRSVKFGVYVLIGLVVASLDAHAERLEPVLRARDVRGTVTVQRGGRGRFEPIEEGLTYPYGSNFRTSAESSVRLAMSEESHIRLLQDTEVTVSENTRNPQVKRVVLRSGEVEAQLGSNFHAGDNILYVEGANSYVKAMGSTYRVALVTESDLHVLVVRVFAGLVRVMSENFEITELGANDWVSILSPPDGSFARLRNLQGEFDVTVIDEDKEQRLLSTEKDTVLKIWQRIVPDTGERIVQFSLSDPNEELVEEITVIFAPSEYAAFLDEVRDEYLDDPDELVRPIPSDRRNPMPPDEFIHELVDRILADLSPGAGVTIRFVPPPSTPDLPTPTPVGRR